MENENRIDTTGRWGGENWRRGSGRGSLVPGDDLNGDTNTNPAGGAGQVLELADWQVSGEFRGGHGHAALLVRAVDPIVGALCQKRGAADGHESEGLWERSKMGSAKFWEQAADEVMVEL